MYTEKDLVAIAKRENNKKRSYLVVDPLQGKHVPVSPSQSLQLFDELAKLVKDAYGDERILFIGFAETATAIGSQVAISVGGSYIQTTREIIEDVNYLFFSEAHSHATEQKLVKEDIESVIRDVDRVIFVEDEVTTGNTILSIIRIMKDNYGEIPFGVASLLNGMNEECLKRYEELGIDLHYLVKTNHDSYTLIADGFACNGEYRLPDETDLDCNIITVEGKVNARRLTDTVEYRKAVEALWNQLKQRIALKPQGSYLVVGTEECMYPAIFVGSRLEQEGFHVRTHSTTRSPIAVSQEPGYPLNTRYELRSVYDDERVTFLYDIGTYDGVFVVTDSELSSGKGLNTLIHALKQNNETVTVIRWA